MKKALIAHVSIVVLLALAVLVSSAGAFDNYSAGCNSCHGSFRAATYSSLAAAKAANPAWPGTSLALHNGHANPPTSTPPGMLNNNCNACHFGVSRTPVYTFKSAGTAPFNNGCSGCHDGPGLRAHHVNSGAVASGDASYCYDCHSDPAPAPENVLRPVYAAAFGTTSGTTQVNDPCNPAAAGFEGRLKDVASIGLDNDGNLLYDQDDPACKPATPLFGVSPSSLAFGNQTVGTTSATQTVTISNTGTAAMTVNTISNSNATDFALAAPATPFNVAAGASQTFTLAFKPGTTGAKTATISITSNGGNGSVGATGTGTAVLAPLFGVSPSSLAFGNQTVGTTSAAQTVTISNTGTAALNVTSITSSSTEFKFSPATISSIAPGGSATLGVTFAPATTGAKTATISITSDGGNGSVGATGTGTAVLAPLFGVSPSSLAFGNQTVGTTSATQTVTISNTGTAAMTVNTISNSNATDFAVSAPATPFNVAAGATQTFTVAFKPGTTGAKTATISITSTGGNGSVGATGTGTAAAVPVLGVSPTTLTFAYQLVGTTSATQTVTLSNTGGAALTVNTISNSNATDFVLAAPATPFTIAAGASQTFTLAFRPGSSGAKTSTISITSDGGNGSVGASGTAGTPAALSLSPTTLTFGNQTVGTTSATQTVTLSNTGGAALTVNTISNSNATDFVLAAPATPFTINGGASQTFTLAFKPGTTGAKTATISITSTGGNGSIGATGTGTAVLAPLFGVSPSSLAFGNQTVGTTSATQTVTISNTGTAALTVNTISNSNTTDFALAAPATPFNVAAGASQTFTLAFKPGTTGAKTATISITSDGGNGSVGATGTGTAVSADYVGIAKLNAPKQITVRGSRSLEIDAYATTTAKKVDATVTLNAAAASGVKVRIDHASVTKEVKAKEQKKFAFDAKITCTKKGTWPVTWTANISAPGYTGSADDAVTGTTQVTCTGSSGNDD